MSRDACSLCELVAVHTMHIFPKHFGSLGKGVEACLDELILK